MSLAIPCSQDALASGDSETDWAAVPHPDLVEELQDGNLEALEWIMTFLRPPLLRYADKALSGAGEPEDLVQDAFARVWTHRESLRPDGSIRGLLYSTVRTLALGEHRRAARQKALLPLIPDPQPPQSPLDDVHYSELRKLTEEAVRRLSPRRETVFRKVRMEGRCYREVARELGLSPQTVANTLTAALTELRDALGPHLGKP